MGAADFKSRPGRLMVPANDFAEGAVPGTRQRVYLLPGQLHASAGPCRITTILGSCVSICLFDADAFGRRDESFPPANLSERRTGVAPLRRPRNGSVAGKDDGDRLPSGKHDSKNLWRSGVVSECRPISRQSRRKERDRRHSDVEKRGHPDRGAGNRRKTWPQSNF